MVKTSEREGGRAVLAIIVVLVLLVAGGYGGAYAAAGDNVPRGARVAGVDIGGRSASAAIEALEQGLADQLTAPITFRVGSNEVAANPAELGLALDLEATVAAAGGGRSADPRRLWEYYTGGQDIDPVVDLDDDLLNAVLDRVDAEVGTRARNGSISFETGRAVVTDPVVGAAVDRDLVAGLLTSSWPSSEASIIDLDLVEIRPGVDDDDISAALEEFANPALSGPVTLVFGESPVELTPREYGAALRLRPLDGELVPGLDRKALLALVDEVISSEEPVDATVELVGGKPRVVPAKPGVEFDKSEITEAFLDLVQQPAGERSAEIEADVAEPEFSTADARALGIRKEVSTFTTYYPPATYRDVNIGRAAEIIDGTVLKPGETFSLNDTVGERTEENGFTQGIIISGGIFREDLGGGVSQMATTLYNAAFFAGLKDVEHRAHTVYIDRYPVGREATVAWGAIDLRFQNNTPHGVLIDTEVIKSAGRSQGTVTVTMYSTPYWDIETVTGDRYRFTSPGERTVKGPGCVPSNGYGGFDINVKRLVRRVGDPELIRTENIYTRYDPSDKVTCKD
jgi:vancomycin resistance protein YoaR